MSIRHFGLRLLRGLGLTFLALASPMALGTARAADTPPPRVFVGATLVDGTGRPPVRDAVVLVRGGVYRTLDELRAPAAR